MLLLDLWIYFWFSRVFSDNNDNDISSLQPQMVQIKAPHLLTEVVVFSHLDQTKHAEEKEGTGLNLK